MNTKIIVALIIGIALIGLTGAVSASMFSGYYQYFDSYSPHSIAYPSPSATESYGSGGYLEVSYSSIYNGDTISGSIIDDTAPFYIAESIPFGGGAFSFSSFASFMP